MCGRLLHPYLAFSAMAHISRGVGFIFGTAAHIKEEFRGLFQIYASGKLLSWKGGWIIKIKSSFETVKLIFLGFYIKDYEIKSR